MAGAIGFLAYEGGGRLGIMGGPDLDVLGSEAAGGGGTIGIIGIPDFET